MSPSDDAQNTGTILRAVLWTTKRARAFLDLVVDRLGGRAVSVASDEGRGRQVYASDDGGIVPWPIATLTIVDPALLDAHEAQADADRVEPWQAAPEPGSAAFHATYLPVAGTLKVAVGSADLVVNYGRDGRSIDASGAIDVAMVAAIKTAVDAGTDSRLELLAAWVAGLAIGLDGPARVLVPRPVPGGPQVVWSVGLRAIRLALAQGRAPVAACWAVADGVAGTALAFGPTRDAALASWREVVARVRPTPPPPTRGPEPGTTFEATSWSPDVEGPLASFVHRVQDANPPPFDGSPDAMPAAIVPLEATKTAAPGRGAWARFLGDRGATTHALRVPLGRGYQLLGEALVGRVDLAALDDARRRAREGPHWQIGEASAARPGAELTTWILRIRCLDAATGLPCTPTVGPSSRAPGFDLGAFDGDALRHSIVEVTPIEDQR